VYYELITHGRSLSSHHLYLSSIIFIGSISNDELKKVFKKLGSNPTDDQIQAMIKRVDVNGDGEIDFEEFLVMMKMNQQFNDPDKDFRDAFKTMDTDGDGTISKKELSDLFIKLGQKLSDEEIQSMMDVVDTDKSGAIDFEEFKAMMLC
jgi:Ca2+-binding EF-hand superfamily protein